MTGIQASVIYRSGPLTRADYDEAIRGLTEARDEDPSRGCGYCGDSGHLAVGCHHNPLVVARRRADDESTWRCFHCREVFTDADKAQEHFGAARDSVPMCLEDFVDKLEGERDEARKREQVAGEQQQKLLARTIKAEIDAGNLKHSMAGMIGMINSMRECVEAIGVKVPYEGNLKADACHVLNAAVCASRGKQYESYGETKKVREALKSAEGERDALLKFKAYVHARLDAAGVPTHPDGPHSKEGCRVGDRLDYLMENGTHMTPDDLNDFAPVHALKREPPAWSIPLMSVAEHERLMLPLQAAIAITERDRDEARIESASLQAVFQAARDVLLYWHAGGIVGRDRGTPAMIAHAEEAMIQMQKMDDAVKEYVEWMCGTRKSL